jgi:site-specific recombinase XerC
MPAKASLRLVKPATQKRAVAPLRRPNSELRSREHLTETEVEKLIEAAKGNRWGHWNATMVLVAYRHGLRASEIVDLRWEQIDFNAATLHVHRVKNGNRVREYEDLSVPRSKLQEHRPDNLNNLIAVGQLTWAALAGVLENASRAAPREEERMYAVRAAAWLRERGFVQHASP